MTSVPLIVTAAAGSTLLPYLDAASQRAAIVVLVVSFLLWSLGMCQVHLILAVYFWRLISHKLPPQQLLASCFLPLAPLGQGAYAIQQMSIFLANYLKSSGYAPTQSQPPPLPQPILLATAEAMHWLGILLNLFLLAHASFWLVQAVAAVAYSRPKSFNIGMWSFTFPWGSYANAWSLLGRDLRNSGMRGWAAANIVIVILIWLFCAGMTSWLGFWKGSLFSAPGLEEWLDEGEQDGQGDGHENGKGRENGATKRKKKGTQGEVNEKKHNADGTYTMDASRVGDVENGMNGHANGNDRQVDDKDSMRARRNGNS
ncbi:hypothetical protein B0A49_05901 [Cryomyces minteri]|uniref:Uncharacterized protein n=1 Tax=Cryomyces minteri TaxID=331657 RepID=A0A4U0WYL9_9PEZI|nr:hypothetical protein B0A49_05901 [Cryomyces minteri]